MNPRPHRPQSPKRRPSSKSRAAPRPEPRRPRGRRAAATGPAIRLQKLLAASGLGSRRAIEALIEAGRITVRGRVAKLGDRASGVEPIEIDGKPVRVQPLVARDPATLPRVLLYHKPAGELVTRDDPQGRPTVFEQLPPVRGSRWASVGRLDFNTSGLLLLTDSGELAHRLMHPRHEIEREYLARVQGELAPAARRRLLEGVALDGGRAAFTSIDALPRRETTGTNRWLRVVLREGRNREVRRLFEAVGMRVSRLIRVRYGPLELPRELRAGEWRELRAPQVRALLEAVGLDESAAKVAQAL